MRKPAILKLKYEYRLTAKQLSIVSRNYLLGIKTIVTSKNGKSRVMSLDDSLII
jgi:hypothetical protein